MSQRVESETAVLVGRCGRIVRAIAEFNQDISDQARRDKYCKMAASPYAFYRGTNHLYWMDFAWDWRLNRFGSHRTRTWVNGDCHAYNFGAYRVRDVGVVYGLNDFDEAIIADYQYDLWRLAVSLVLIAREHEHLKRSGQRKVVNALSQAYLDALRSFVGNRRADRTCYTVDNTHGRLRKLLARVKRKKSRRKQLEKWTRGSRGRLRFVFTLDKLDPVDEAVCRDVERAIEAYTATVETARDRGRAFFEVKDVARRREEKRFRQMPAFREHGKLPHHRARIAEDKKDSGRIVRQ